MARSERGAARAADHGLVARQYLAASRGRHDALAWAYLSGGHTMKAIAGHFGVHYATVSRSVRHHEGHDQAAGIVA